MNAMRQTSDAVVDPVPTTPSVDDAGAAPAHGHHPIHWCAEHASSAVGAIHHLFDHHPDDEDRHRRDIHRHYDFIESAEMSREIHRL